MSRSSMRVSVTNKHQTERMKSSNVPSLVSLALTSVVKQQKELLSPVSELSSTGKYEESEKRIAKLLVKVLTDLNATKIPLNSLQDELEKLGGRPTTN